MNRVPIRNRKITNTLNKVYFDINSSASYAGANKVYREAKRLIPKLKYADVKEFLEGQSTHTMYKPQRKRFKRLATIPSGLNSDWQCDLAIMDMLSKNNDGYKYMLVCVDVLSRKMYVAPVKSKSPKQMIPAFNAIFSKAKPLKLYSDRGLEFQAKEMLKFFQDQDIVKHVVYTRNIHAGIVERANRTIKERLYRYFHKHKTHRWVDVIDKIINNINNSVNRTIGMTPNQVTLKNSQILYKELYGDAYSAQEPKFNVGDVVRIVKDKGVFGKGYHPSYSRELFRIRVAKHTRPPHYKLQDMEGADIMGVYYEPELSLVRLNIGDQKL